MEMAFVSELVRYRGSGNGMDMDGSIAKSCIRFFLPDGLP